MIIHKIYGAFDDLIEVVGLCGEEFHPHQKGEADYLAFSDGTVLSVEYTSNGLWRINRVATGSAEYAKIEATDPEGDYTDRVTLTGDIGWCVFGSRIEKATKGKPQ